MSDLARRISSLSPRQRALLERRLRREGLEAPQPRIPRRPPARHHPLSFGQERLWFIDRFTPGGSAYNNPFVARLKGPLDASALEASLREIVRRHEVLRSRFVAVGGRGAQEVLAAPRVEMPVLAVERAPAGEREDVVRRLAREEIRRPFDLETGPPVRALLLRLDPEEHALVVTMHHMVSDGWSAGVLFQELAALYPAFVAGGAAAALPELPLQYADFAVWQREWLDGPRLDRLLAYWTRRLADLPPLQLPTDRPRPPVQTDRGARQPVVLPELLTRSLAAFARHEGATLFMALMAAFQALLFRHAGQADFGMGTPVAGRDRAELEPLVGCFVNTLVLRADLSGRPTFRDLVRGVRATALDAFAHQELPFEKLVDALELERDLSMPVLAQVLLVLHNTPPVRAELAGLELEEIEVDPGTAKLDLMLELREDRARLRGAFEHNSDLFDPTTIRRLAECFQSLLAAALAAPDRPVAELPVLTGAERQRLLREWNDTARPAPAAVVHGLVEARAKASPGAAALVSPRSGRSLSYRELDRRTNRLAHHLRGLGVGPEERVGLLLSRTPELVVGALAVLKAGGAYVPLDPAYPRERILFMLEDSGASVLVCEERLRRLLPDRSRVETICLESDAPAIAAHPPTPPPVPVTPGNLAYLIYTSGSTGRPKGVMIEHRAASAFLEWTREAFGAEELAGVLASTSASFDLSVFEFFAPLVRGGSVVLVEDSLELAGAPLEGISLVNTVPSALAAVLERARLPDSVRTVALAGEPLTVALAARVFERSRARRLLNLYGPSEDTTYSTWASIARDQASPISIGRPVAGTRAHVLDGSLAPVPAGVPGELLLGGAGLARGYLDRPALTAERFLPDPFGEAPGSRLYHTGDLVRFLPDGQLRFLGRLDHQVKVRGFRIEPGEIEACLRRHPEVQDAVVVAREDEPGTRRLVAYAVPRSGAPDAAELRDHLRRSLPEHMVPAAFVLLDALPLTANGKLDRGALPAPGGRSGSRAGFAAPSTPAEEALAAIWAEVLGLDRVGAHDNFFELGGDSILSLQVIGRARDEGLALAPQQVFQHPTVAELARATGAAPSRTTAPAEQGPVTGPVPLTPIQCWFFEQRLGHPDQFNFSALVELPRATRAPSVAAALRALADHHDALRLRFRRTADGWSQEIAPPGEPVPLAEVSLVGKDEIARERAFRRAAARLQASLDLASGPLLRAAFFDRGLEAPRLLAAVHHLAVDGVSWRILLADLASALDRLHRGEAVRLPPKSTSFLTWANQLRALASSGELAAELPFWEDQSPGGRALPGDRPGGGNTVGSARRHAAALDEEATRSLLREVPAAARAGVEEVLLAALARAWWRWTGETVLAIHLEGHGREGPFPDADLSRTVGWFTSLYPLRLELADPEDLEAALRAVKARLRTVPRRGAGYGLLRYLTSEGRERLSRRPAPALSFNYLGRFQDEVGGPGGLRLLAGDLGPERSPAGERAHLLELDCAVVGGRLRLVWTYPGERLEGGAVARLAGELVAALHGLLAAARAAGGPFAATPSDFPLARLDRAALDRLLAAHPDLEDLYPLSPLQQGLLFHALFDPGAATYFEQLGFEAEGDLDRGAFDGAWRTVVERHAVLRSALVWEGVPEPLQVVRRRPPFEVSWLDWRGLDEPERRLDQHLEEDRRRGFDLGRAPLLRVAVIRLGDRRHRIVWSFHHVLLDGWSVAIVLQELFAAYRAATGGEPLDLPPAAPYRVYLAWLAGRDPAAAEGYWRAALRGAAPGRLELDGPGEARGAATEERVVLDAETTAALARLARERHLTLNTLVQGAWALLLDRYGGAGEVVFGATVATRPAELARAEVLVGLLINTLPVRVEVPAGALLLEWLRDLQAAQSERRPFEHVPLERVQAWTGIPPGEPLFETLFVLENYPLGSLAGLRADAPGLTIRPAAAFEETHYPLTLVAVPGETLALRLQYRTERFSAAAVRRLGRHLRNLLGTMARDPGRPLWSYSPLDEGQRRQVVVEWNDTAAAAPELTSVHQLFAAQVERRPEAVALAFPEGRQLLTYGEIDARASRLARVLREHGVGPDVPVAVCLERSLEMVVAVLGTLQAGGAYVPLDPAYPAERLRNMLEDSGARVLVAGGARAERLAAGRAGLIRVGPEAGAAAAEAPVPLGPPPSPDHLAYVLYTSGSTGRPKGAALPHRALLGLLLWQRERSSAGAGGRTLQLAPLSFDVSFQEIFATFVAGGTLVLVSEELRRDAPALLRSLGDQRVERVFAPFVALRHLAEVGPELPPSVREVVTAGEQLQVSPALLRLLGDGHWRLLDNQYGPTETHVVTAFRLPRRSDRWETLPAIGRPLPNVRVLLLDRSFEPAPPGLPADLCVAGASLARGYAHRPGLTAERFVPDPYSPGPGGRLYQTGDRARFRADGTIEFLGRADRQVKVRGFRVEPGEVEAALAGHPEVREVAVAPWRQGEETALAAYVVPRGERPPASAELRSWAGARLPEHMVPAAFAFLEALPSTPSGKLDRRALPAPGRAREQGRAFAAPRTPVEVALAGIWQEVLGLERVGVHDGFTAAGGHSLAAVRVLSRVREAFGVELPLRALFECPDLAALARRLEAAPRPEREPPLVRVPRGGDLPLSFMQERLWFLHRLDPGGATYNMPLAVRLTGSLDAPLLKRSLQVLVGRHEVLRATFPEREGRPVMVPRARLDLRLPREDLRGLSPPVREAARRGRAREEASRPFDLAMGPLVRARLLVLADREHVLLLTVHHIAADGWSLSLLTRELARLYEALRHGVDDPLPEPPLQYADFAAWQRRRLRGPRRERQLRYWQEALRGAPPRLELPTDRPRPLVQTYRGARVSGELEPGPARELRRLAEARGATLFTVLLAAFAALLHRWSRQEEVVIGAPVATRDRPELEAVAGPFLNLLPLRTNLSGHPSFETLVGRLRETVLQAQAHRDLPFEALLEALEPERDPSRTPVFQVLLNLLSFPRAAVSLEGLTVEPLAAHELPSKFDLTLYAEESGEGLAFELAYNADLFDRPRMAELLRQLQGLLRQAAADPRRGLLAYSLVTAEARAVLPDPAAPLDDAWEGAVHDHLSRWARAAPERVAVVDREGAFTYGELEAAANRLARHLLRGGVRPGDVVAVYGHRSAALVWAVMAALKAGATLLVLDPAQPPARQVATLRPARPRAWLHLGAAGPLPAGLEAWLEREAGPCLRLDLPALGAAGRGPWAGEDAEPPGVAVGPDDPACLCFTSGTTGAPRGVVGRHRSLSHFVPWLSRTFELGSGDRWSLLSGLAHDPLQRDVFTPLQLGAAIAIPDPAMLLAPGWLARWAAEQGVTVANLTPAMAQVLATGAEGSVAGLRRAFVVGEVLLHRDVRRLLRVAPGVECVALYGTTETQRALAYHAVLGPAGGAASAVEGPVPLGRGMPDAQLLLLNGAGGLCGVGEAGEVCLRSPHLAAGYLGDPELTRERFLVNPATGREGDRLYRTGDLGRYRSDGLVEWAGRADRQIQVRGVRVEPGEIEARLRDHPEVRQAVVIAREEAGGERALVAYVVPEGAEPPAPSELRSYLREWLPEVMVPSRFVPLQALPLTPNGKVDRRALPEPPPLDGAGRSLAPRDRLELELVRIWEEILGRPVGVRDDFFEHGGHSLAAVRLLARTEAELGRAVPLPRFFQEPTVERVAAFLRGVGGPPGPPSRLVVLREGGPGPPLFCVHPLGGTVVCYRELARRLGSDRPVFALEAPGLDGRSGALDRVEALASLYVREVRRRQERGPYRLLGWSFGGLVAFEMARQLTSAGEEAWPVLLDSRAPGPPGPPAEAPDDLEEREERELLRLLARGLSELTGIEIRPALESLGRLGGRDERVRHLLEEARRVDALPPEVGLDQVRPLVAVVEAHRRASAAYAPEPFAGRLAVIRARDPSPAAPPAPPGNPDPSLGWGALARGGLRAAAAPGDHEHLLSEPFVGPVTDRVRRALAWLAKERDPSRPDPPIRPRSPC
jgi:amino acid adenylation domain-containing protein/non-ribosomal peptide synthase protein (TIGR01720 family)